MRSRRRAAVAAALGVPPAALDGVAIVWPDWGASAGVRRRASARRARSRRCCRAPISRRDRRLCRGRNEARARDRAAISAIRIQARLLLGSRHREMAVRRRLRAAAVQPQPRRDRRSDGRARSRRTDACWRCRPGFTARSKPALRAEARRAREPRCRARARRCACASSSSTPMSRCGSAPAIASIARPPKCSRCARSSKPCRRERSGRRARNALEDALHAPLSGPELALAKPDGRRFRSRTMRSRDSGFGIRDSRVSRRARIARRCSR